MSEQNKIYDVVVVGGGIVGCAVFNAIVRNGNSAILLEAEDDVGAMSTKANSGIIHAGYDPKPNSLMAITNLRGNEMYASMCKRLNVEIKNCGTLVVATNENREKIQELYDRGIANKVKGLKILERDALLKLEPNLADNIVCGLFASTASIVCPYLVCIALAEEGVINGGKVITNFRVSSIKKGKDIFTVKDDTRTQTVYGKYVVNCAGLYANFINSLVDEQEYPIKLVKGEYILLDKSQSNFVNRPIFPLPTEKGKGILAIPTLHGNVMFGPTATDCSFHDTSTTPDGLEQIKNNVILSVKKPNFKKTIKLFAGVRVKSGSDFVIEKSKKVPNFYYTIGICSPGLTSAPAIAEMILNMLQKDGLKSQPIKLKQRKPYGEHFALPKSELKKLIKKNPAYGKIVCRCEKVSEGEIIDALNSPLHPRTVDAIKRRIRPTMGKCQGSFCMPKIVKMIADYEKIQQEDVTQKGEKSEILVGDIKQGGIYDL